MRITAFLLFVLLLTSCSQMPFSKWNENLTDLENQLNNQKKEANSITTPDISLFQGVYAASKDKNAVPYPRVKIIADNLEFNNRNLSNKTDSCLEKIGQFRVKYGGKRIKTLGPEWNDYSNLLAQANRQTDENINSLTKIKSSDKVFDSICEVHDIKRIPLLEYQAQLELIISQLEREFTALSNSYNTFKKEITSRASRENSMRAIGEMRQKIRSIESEQLELSNLHSRLKSLKNDTIFYTGPHIDKVEEILLIESQTNLLTGLLGQLRTMEDAYSETE